MDEILQHLVSTCNANGFLVKEENVRRKRVKKHRLIRAVENCLTPAQAQLLQEILGRRWAVVGGFAVRRDSDTTWVVHGLDAFADEHRVFADLSACSCPDNKFRGRECKHIDLLRGWLP